MQRVQIYLKLCESGPFTADCRLWMVFVVGGVAGEWGNGMVYIGSCGWFCGGRRVWVIPAK